MLVFCFVFIFLLFSSVNYRGSLGFGQDSILSLPGNVGTQDVKDVQVRKNLIKFTAQWTQFMISHDFFFFF